MPYIVVDFNEQYSMLLNDRTLVEDYLNSCILDKDLTDTEEYLEKVEVYYSSNTETVGINTVESIQVTLDLDDDDDANVD